jgi:hypothetical protein
MDKLWFQAGLLNLVRNPVPIAGRFQSYRRAWLSTAKTLQDCSRAMLNTHLLPLTGLNLFSFHQRVALVAIKCYKLFHARLLSSGEDYRQYIMTAGVALSYFHSGMLLAGIQQRRRPSAGLNAERYVEFR